MAITTPGKRCASLDELLAQRAALRDDVDRYAYLSRVVWTPDDIDSDDPETVELRAVTERL